MLNTTHWTAESEVLGLLCVTGPLILKRTVNFDIAKRFAAHEFIHISHSEPLGSISDSFIHTYHDKIKTNNPRLCYLPHIIESITLQSVENQYTANGCLYQSMNNILWIYAVSATIA